MAKFAVILPAAGKSNRFRDKEKKPFANMDGRAVWLRSAELFAFAYLSGKPLAYERLWRRDFGRELQRASQMRRKFYGNFWGAPFTERMIEFARGHRGIKRVLGKLIAGEQGYLGLKRKLARSAVRPL